MKKTAAFLAALTAALLPVSALAGETAADAFPLADRLRAAGSFFGNFLLVMGVIFAVLLLTRRIAAWIDKQRDKHKT